MNTLGKNRTFPIYKSDGTSFHDLVLHKSTCESVVMSLGDKITGDVYYKDNTLAVTMQEYIKFKVNPDDANEDEVKYVLVNPPTVIREGMASDNSELKGMTKYSFTFYHPMYMLGNFPFTDIAVLPDQEKYLSQNKSFSWIGKPQDYIDKLNKNLQGTVWYVRKSDRFPIEKDDELSEVQQFDNISVAEAVKKGYEIWGTPYVVSQLPTTDPLYAQGKRFVVEYGLPSNEIYENDSARQLDTPFVFHIGQGVGLKNNSRTPRNNKIVTRIAGYGSEDNVPYGYPQIVWTGNQDWDYTINNDPNDPLSYPIYKGIVGGQYVKLIKHPFTRTHLMPSIFTETVNKKVNPNAIGYNPAIEIKDYYDAVATQEYPYTNEINPQAPSYESHEFEDIKPELDADRTAGIVSAIPLNADLTPADHWDDSMDDDGNYLQSFFQITLPQLSFDLYACAAITQEMQINMRSGDCIGCTFTIQVDWDDYKRNFYDEEGNFVPDGEQRDLSKYPKSNLGQISVVVQKDNNTFGTLMPNIYQQPKQDDLFVFIGISLPLSYITSAELRLDDAMKSYMLENNVFYFDYPLKFDEHFLATQTHILEQIRPNSIIHFDYGGVEQQLFVKQLTVKYGNAPLPQYDITLTDNIDVVLNQIGQVANDVENLSSLISILRQSYSRNIWNEIAKKLSKSQDDVAQGLIGFVKGLWVKANGLFGIAADGAAKVYSLLVNGQWGIASNGDVTAHDITAAQVIASLLKSPDFVEAVGMIGNGFGVTIDANGKAKVQTDDLLVLGRMIVNSLNIREVTYIGGTYLLTPAGSTVAKVLNLNCESGHESFESKYWSPLGEGTTVGYRLLWLADNGTTSTMNYWKVGDQAFCEVFNIQESGTYENFSNRRWWRLVTRKGICKDDGEIITANTDLSDYDGKVWNFVDVSNISEVCLYNDAGTQIYNEGGGNFFGGYENNNGSIPAVEDKVVCLGSQTDTTRQGAIQITAEGTASIGIYDGINNYEALRTHEIHYFSKEAVRMSSRYFTWTTANNDSQPPTVYRGTWTSGKLSYYGDEWTYNGSNWLCIYNGSTPLSLSEAPGTTAAYWVQVKGQDGSYYVNEYARCNSREADSQTGAPTGTIDTTYGTSGWDAVAPAPTDTYPYIWRRSRLYNPNTQQYGSYSYVCETGKTGDSEKNVTVYKDSPFQPATPTGSTIPPTGWSLQPKVNAFEDATDQDHIGWRVAKGLGDEDNILFINERLLITASQSTSISITIESSCEDGYDFIGVGNLDSALSNWDDFEALDSSRKATGNGDKKTFTIDDLTAGEHFIDIAYFKDESTAAYDDCGWYRYVASDGADVKISQNRIWASVGSFTNNVLQGTWSEPVEWSGQDGKDGNDGNDGEDGYTVVSNPEYIIFEESYNAQDGSASINYNVVSAQVQIKLGNTAQYILNTSKSVSPGTGIVANKAIASIDSETGTILTLSFESGFITGSSVKEGYVQLGIATCQTKGGSTADGRFSYDVKIPFYVNRMGTFGREIIGGISREFATQPVYTPNGLGNLIKTDYEMKIEESAQGLTVEFTEDISRALGTSGRNLFGFHKGCYINGSMDVTDYPCAPFIEGYGIVLNKSVNSYAPGGGTKADRRRGMISNLGLEGVGGDFVVSFQIMRNDSITSNTYVTFCEKVNGSIIYPNKIIINGKVSSSSRVISTNATWKDCELYFSITDEDAAKKNRNGFIEFTSNTRDKTSDADIYIRHLKIERGTEKTAFCEADEDISYRGGSNMIGSVTATTPSFTEYEDAFNVKKQCYGYLYNASTSSEWTQLVSTSVSKKLEAGKVYTLSYWAACYDNNSVGWAGDGVGVVISNMFHLASGITLIEDVRNDICKKKVLMALPTASSSTMDGVYSVRNASDDADNGDYITVDNGQQAEVQYTWRRINDADDNVGIQEGVSSDGTTHVTLIHRQWVHYFVRFYVTNNIDVSDITELVALTINKTANTSWSGAVYIAEIALQEGYVMDTLRYNSLIQMSARRISMGVSDGLSRTGIDIENRKITATADNFEIKNNNGDTTFSVDEDGNIVGAGDASFNGTVKADNFYHRCVTFWPDTNYLPAQRQYIGPTTSYFKKGRTYDLAYLDGLESENPSAWTYYEQNKSAYFIPCTGDADIVNFTVRTSGTGDLSGPVLPDPNYYPGKVVHVYTYDYSGRNNTIYIGCTAMKNGQSVPVLTFSVYPALNGTEYYLRADGVLYNLPITLGNHYMFHSIEASQGQGESEYVWWCIRTK